MLPTLRQVIARIRALFGGSMDRDFADELESHLAMLTDEYVSRGMEPGEARRRAAIRIGNPTTLRMQHRDTRSFRIVDEVVQDLRFAARLFRKERVFSAAAVISLALGIGATTAIFTVVNAVLLRPLPYPEPHELIAATQRHPQFGLELVTLPDFEDWQSQSTTLRAIAGAWNAAFNMSGGDEPERLTGAMVTPGFFEAFNLVPAAGTLLSTGPSGDALVVVLGHDLWRRRFNGSPDAIGRSVQLNNRTFTVAGVAPPGFAWPGTTELWIPLVREESMNRGYHMLQVVGRLKPGATVDQAQADLSAIAAATASEYPATNKDWGVQAQSLLAATVAPSTRPLWILIGAAACLLLIACANVASLLASRAVSRRVELALRRALGASRHRLLRQMLTESVVFTTIAGAAGLLIAVFAVDPLISLTTLPRSGEIAIDWRVFSATVVLSIATACAIGLLSAWQASRAQLRDVQAGRASTRTGWLRPSLIAAEVAMCVILLTGSGLLIRSFSRLQQVEVGFDAPHLLTLRFFLPRAGYPADRAVRMYEDMIDRVSGIRGVSSAAAVSAFPFAGATPNVAFGIPSQPAPAPGSGPSADFASMTPGYLKTMGLRLIAGRDFDARDSANAPFVAIVTRSMAETFFPGQDAIGQTIRILGPRPRTIVGIVSEARQRTLDRSPQPQIYLPHAQQPLGGMFLVVRAASDHPERLINDVRAQIRSLDRALPIASVMTADQLMGNTLSARRFTLVLITLFSAAALALAMVGIYGVLSFAVAQRRSEIGIRMALGARHLAVVSLMMWHGMWPVVFGLVAGLGAAAAASRVLSTLLFEISERDPLTLAAVSTILLSTALVAAFLPSRRAALVDPRIALQ